MKYEIKLAKKHPYGAMYCGPYKITNESQVIDIPAEHEFYLKTEEAKHWFSIVPANGKKEKKNDPIGDLV